MPDVRRGDLGIHYEELGLSGRAVSSGRSSASSVAWSREMTGWGVK